MPYVVVFALAWSIFGSGVHAEQHLTFATPAAAQVHVRASNGFVSVTTGRSGAGVSVTVTKRADTFDEVRALGVGTAQRGSDISLRAVYPKGCGSSCGGEISFTIVVPPGSVLDVQTSNGHITATGISGDARLASSNGAVSATYAAFNGVKRVSLETSNGQLSLALPASAKIGRLHVSTSVGHISSDWPVRVDRSDFVGGSVNQTLAPGAASVWLDTANGSISLKKI